MKISVLRFMVKTMSKQGKTDINRDCESFFATVLNHVYGYGLKNVNNESMNEAAIDLADERKRLCFQVTATSSSTKIKKTIKTFTARKLYSKYSDLKFLMLVEKEKYTTTFDTGGLFKFNHEVDVIDIDDVLVAAEKLDLSKLRELSDFVDAQLLTVAKALEPDGLLANAESDRGLPPVTADRFLRSIGSDSIDDPKEMQRDLKIIKKLQKTLMMSCSRKQREVVFYMFMFGKRGAFNWLSLPFQTLEQRLGIDSYEMKSYYDALKTMDLMDIDDNEHPTAFVLAWSLRGCNSEFFTELKGFLNGNEENAKRVLIDGDFTVLD
ncbi:hypothetical protein WM29_08625 [Burkholderia ubonensis]|nr:hypothetical protein WM29_08625 [Burkholderia ubonensis]